MQLPVTVVVPTFDRAAHIERALRSIAAQTAQASQVIVVDDGSSDGTCELVESLGLGVEVLRQANAGPGAARNTGLGRAREQWVAFLDSDDWWLPHHLERLWAAHEGRVLVSGNSLSSIHGRLMGNPGRRDLALVSAADLLWPENPVVTSSALVHRDTAVAVGGFDLVLRSEDLGLWLRMLGAGSGIALREVTGVYREHPGQVSGDNAAMRASLRELMSDAATDAVPSRIRRRMDDRLWWDELRARQDLPAAKKAIALSVQVLRSPRSVRSLSELLLWRWRARQGRAMLPLVQADTQGSSPPRDT